LAEAIERVRMVYDEAHRRRMSRLEVAQLLGYGSLNGAAITMVANLSRYGLLEGRGDQIRVSDDALTVLIEPEESPERGPALRRLALRPELFAELDAENEGGVLPGETAIRVRLERRGLARHAAEVAASAFRETMQLVAESEGAYTPPQVASDEDDRGGSMQSSASSAAAPIPPRAVGAPPTGSEGTLLLNVPFRGTTLSVRVDVKGQALRKEHVERVRAYLKLASADLEGEGAGEEQD
jgi:hypothetical protein